MAGLSKELLLVRVKLQIARVEVLLSVLARVGAEVPHIMVVAYAGGSIMLLLLYVQANIPPCLNVNKPSVSTGPCFVVCMKLLLPVAIEKAMLVLLLVAGLTPEADCLVVVMLSAGSGMLLLLLVVLASGSCVALLDIPEAERLGG